MSGVIALFQLLLRRCRQLSARLVHLLYRLRHALAVLGHTVDVVADVQQTGGLFRLTLGEHAAGQQLRRVVVDVVSQIAHLIGFHFIVMKILCLAAQGSLCGVEHIGCHIRTAADFLRQQVHRCNRLLQQLFVQKLRLAVGLRQLVLARNNRRDQLDHDRQQRQPNQRAHNVEASVCIGNLAGNDVHLVAARRDIRDKCRKRANQTGKDNGTGDVENAVRNRGALGSLGLANGCQQRGDGRADVVAEQNRNRTRQTNHAGHAVSGRLRGKVLQHRNRCGRALYHQRHRCAEQHTERRNFRDTAHQVGEHGAACERLHDAAHNLDALKQQTERENNHADVLCLFALGDKVHEKANKNNRVDVIADFKRHQLGGHRRADVRAEDNRNTLRQRHQTRADKTNDHNRGRGRALQHGGYQGAGECAHNRVLGQKTQNLLHALARCLLQGVAHAVHAEQEHRETSGQSKDRRHNLIHNFLL